MSKTYVAIGVLLAVLSMKPNLAFAVNCSAIPTTFTNGTTADAAQVNGNFSYLGTCAAAAASPSFTGTISGASQALTGQLTDTQSIGNTSTLGVGLLNTTAATSAQVQWSPALRFSGFSWNTSVAASHAMDWLIDNETTSSSGDNSLLNIKAQINGGGYSNIANFGNIAPQFNLNQSNPAGITELSVLNANATTSTQALLNLGTGTTNAYLQAVQVDGATPMGTISTGAGDTGGLQVSSAAGPVTLAPANGLVPLTGALQAAGTKFTISGCSVTTSTGGSFAGTYKSGVAACTVTITLGATAPNGWSCFANDQTHNTYQYGQSESASTTTTVTITGTTVAADIINFACFAY